MRTQTYALRAPEIILGADYGVKVDIIMDCRKPTPLLPELLYVRACIWTRKDGLQPMTCLVIRGWKMAICVVTSMLPALLWHNE